MADGRSSSPGGGTRDNAEPSRIVVANDKSIARAGVLLRQGSLVALPTETVYGLAADATNARAVAALFAAKGRPRFNPLIAHVADTAAAEALAWFDARAAKLAAAFWPGPLTLVLLRRAEAPVCDLACAGLASIALRVPAHPMAQAVIRAAGGPLAMPSANVSGRISPTQAVHVAEELGDKVAMILDGGPAAIGVESTVIDLTGPVPTVLRPGGITLEALAEGLEEEITLAMTETGDDPEAILAPGMMTSHYAPSLPVRLEASGPAEWPDEALLAFGAAVPEGYALVLNLSPIGDLREAAANLFTMLRELDRPGLGRIAVMPIPRTGLGLAINDRLTRAAACRE